MLTFRFEDYRMSPIEIDKSKLHVWVDRMTNKGGKEEKIDRFEVVKCTKELMQTEFAKNTFERWDLGGNYCFDSSNPDDLYLKATKDH